jgi:TP901 family phage tail tape measure protein
MAIGKNIKGITIEFGARTVKLDTALSDVKQKSKSVNQALRDINRNLKFNPKNAELLAQKQKALADRVETTTSKLKALKAAEEQLSEEFKNKKNGQAEFEALRREIISTEQQLKRFKAEYERLGSVKLTRLGESFQQMGAKMETAGKKLMPFSTAFLGIGYAASRAAIDFETAWAGVTKTVDGTPQQLAKIKQGILDLSKETSSSATDIAAVAEAAGQLGIKTDDILEFTRVMVMLGDTTNLSSEEAASALAKYANITGLTADNYKRLGSAIVDLGNNFATTEADIVNFAMRIAASGKQVGFTDQQILALSTALSSVGLEAEAGGSAVSKVLTAIDKAVSTNGKTLSTWAETAGMSVSDFKRAWEKDAYSAFQKVVRGMGDAKKGGENLNVLLEELGVTNIRTSDAMKRLSSASDLFSRTTATANKAWGENKALTAEAEKKYKTTAAQIQQLKAAFVEIGVELGDTFLPEIKQIVGNIKDFTKGLKNLSPEAKHFIVRLIEIGAVAGPTLITLGRLSQGIGTLSKGFSHVSGMLKSAKGAKDTTDKLAKGVDGLTKSTKGLKVMNTATAGVGAFGAKLATVALIIGVATVGIVGLGAAIYTAYHNAHKERKAIDEMARAHEAAVEKVNANAQSAEIYRKRLDSLIGVENKSATQKQLMQKYVEKLNTSVEGLNLTYDAESDKLYDNTGKLVNNTNAIKEQIEAMKERALADAYMQNATESLEKYAEYTQKLSQAESERAEVKEKIDKLTEKGTELKKSERNELATLVETYKKLGRNMDGYYEGMASALVEAQKWNNTMEIQAGALNNLQGIAESAGIKIPKSLEAGIRGGKYTIPSTVDELKALIDFDSAVQNAKEKGIEIPENLQAGILSGEIPLSEATSKLNDAVKTGVAGMPSDMNKTGTSAATEIINGMDERKSDVSNKASELSKGAKDSADVEAAKASDTGALFGGKFAEGIYATNYAATYAGQQVGVSGRAGAGSVSLYDVGYNAGAGFANGLSGAMWLATNAARNIAEQALYAAKRRLDVRSPSREFAKIGRFSGEGLAIGLEATGKDVAKASEELGEIALTNAQAKLSKIGAINSKLAGITSTRTAGFAFKPLSQAQAAPDTKQSEGITYKQMAELIGLLIAAINNKDSNVIIDVNAIADFATQRINKNMGKISERERRQ